jgi:hypothetical protein
MAYHYALLFENKPIVYHNYSFYDENYDGFFYITLLEEENRYQDIIKIMNNKSMALLNIRHEDRMISYVCEEILRGNRIKLIRDYTR